MAQDPIVQAFETRLHHHGAEIVVLGPESQVTRQEIDVLARSLETALVGPSRLPPGTLVGLAVADGPGFLAALVALRRIRCAAILLDAKGRPEGHRRTSTRLGARWLLSSKRSWPKGPEDFLWTSLAPSESPEGEPSPPGRVPETIAVLKLTSGSTGAPRGILTSSVALLADDRALAATMGLRDDEHILAAIPFSHSYGLASVVLPALTRGNRLILPEAGNPFTLLKTGHWGEATFLPTVPAYLRALVKMSSPPAWPPSLRLVISAGAPLKAETAQAFRRIFGRPVHVFYGSSETGGITYDREGGAAERGTLGTAVEGVEIRVEKTDSPSGPLSPGERGGKTPASGLVVVSSAAVATGYWPEADEALDHGRFRTSDLGTWEPGPGGEKELRLLGRADDQINVKGKKVNPKEIEAVLLEIPGVDEAAVLGLPAPGGGQLIRAVLACDSVAVTTQEVLAHCRGALPAHKLPRSIIFVGALPRTSRGKLDRQALREMKG